MPSAEQFTDNENHIGELIMPTKKTVKKTKNVLIISASFRPNSNSHALCQEVAKGVKAAGNKALGGCDTGAFRAEGLGLLTEKRDRSP